MTRNYESIIAVWVEMNVERIEKIKMVIEKLKRLNEVWNWKLESFTENENFAAKGLNNSNTKSSHS